MQKTQAFLGIDVSKGYADFVLMTDQKQVLEPGFRLDDNSAGRKQLRALLQGWFSDQNLEIICGVESTGGYENNWLRYLQQLVKVYPLKVSRLNAKAVKAISDASLRRTITDVVSAENIAMYMMSFPEKIDHTTGPAFSVFTEARQQYSYIKMLLKQKIQLSNQLEKLLYQNLSELIIYCKHGIPNWLLAMLTKYPSAQLIVKAGTRLSAINGISRSKAEAIVAKLKDSIQITSPALQHTIKATAREILHKDEMIDEEKDFLCQQFKDHPDVKLLESIKGIGLYSAVNIMIEIESIERFDTVKKLSSYFGIHPTFKQSGDGKWGSHISKKGRPEIRAALYICGLCAIRFDANMKQLYARFRTAGFNHYKAMGVVMHKLLRIIYGVLKYKQAYDPQKDRDNSMKAEKARELAKAEKKQALPRLIRYQELTQTAPVSNRASKKRKEQIASQTSHSEVRTGLPAAPHSNL